MSKAMHAKPFRLTGPYTARHARPESPRSKLIRAVSLGLACVCLLLTATVYPASAATNSTSMASLQTRSLMHSNLRRVLIDLLRVEKTMAGGGHGLQ